MQPIIDHIAITVKDISIAEPFYDKLMPILGFSLDHKFKGTVAEHEMDVVEYCHPLLLLSIGSPRKVFKMTLFIAESLVHYIILRLKQNLAMKLINSIRK